MKKHALAYFALTFVFSALYLRYLLKQNEEWNFSGSISLARLVPVMIVPTFVGIFYSLFSRLGFADYGWKLKNLRKNIWYAVGLLILMFGIYAVTDDSQFGHMGKFIFFVVIGVPVSLIASFGPVLGWFGFFAPKVHRALFPRAPFIVAGSYSLWITATYVGSVLMRNSFPLRQVISLAALSFGFSFICELLRRRTQSLWPVVGLHLVLLISFVFYSPLS